MERLQLTVYGKVQGVSFRYFVRKNALNLSLAGYVKNLENDKVFIIAEGEKENLNKLLEACKKGPPSSNVKKLDINFSDAENEFNSFEIRTH